MSEHGSDGGVFSVSRPEFYRKQAERPEVQAFARWADRHFAAQSENHDPGDEDRSER